MTDQSFVISFSKASIAESNKDAESLRTALRKTDRSISVERRRSSAESLDGGATLAIVLGSAAVSAVAKGIAIWLARNSGTEIEIHAPDGTSVRVRNASGQDTAQTVEAALLRTQ